MARWASPGYRLLGAIARAGAYAGAHDRPHVVAWARRKCRAVLLPRCALSPAARRHRQPAWRSPRLATTEFGRARPHVPAGIRLSQVSRHTRRARPGRGNGDLYRAGEAIARPRP